MFRGDRFRLLRQSNGYTHADIAELLDVNVRMIARYENGESAPNSDIVIKMSEVFKVSADYLLSLSDDPSPHLKIDNLTQIERDVLAAMRRGDTLEAIRRLAEKNGVAAVGD